jgi:hypothetical protein
MTGIEDKEFHARLPGQGSHFGRIADIVGMTIASEATLARELGLRFAAVCTVDNYAHGLGEEVLTYEGILDSARKQRDRTGEMIRRIVGAMSAISAPPPVTPSFRGSPFQTPARLAVGLGATLAIAGLIERRRGI